MKTRMLNKNDCNEVAAIHIQAFEGFFLTTLGIRFLRTYYKSCFKCVDTIAFGINDDNNNLIGFATGTILSKGYHKKILLNNLFSFLYSIIQSVIFRPSVLIRLAFNINKNKENEDDGVYSELLSIGVIPDKNGKGIGAILLQEFEIEAKKRGASKIALTTDLFQNERVIRFYTKSGYETFYEFNTYPNRRMLKMIKIL